MVLGLVLSCSPPEKLVYGLEYVAADYGFAVRDGGIANAYEYAEMLAISRRLVEHADELLAHGAPEDTRARLARLREDILARRPPAEVRATARGLVLAVLEALDAVSLPAAPPSADRARGLYAAGCEPCHGPSGGGDGRAAPGMEPPPVSFRDGRMNLVSPHQMYVAIAHGIDGTAMPSYSGAFTPAEMWDLSFFVLTLREGFDPQAPAVALPLTLRELALLANDELLGRALRAFAGAGPEHIDYYRSIPAHTGGGRGGPDER
jgi:high-affinity iron transporter